MKCISNYLFIGVFSVVGPVSAVTITNGSNFDVEITQVMTCAIPSYSGSGGAKTLNAFPDWPGGYQQRSIRKPHSAGVIVSFCRNRPEFPKVIPPGQSAEYTLRGGEHTGYIEAKRRSDGAVAIWKGNEALVAGSLNPTQLYIAGYPSANPSLVITEFQQ